MSQDAARREYLAEHAVEKVLVAAVARILKERPADPIAALGNMLCKPCLLYTSPSPRDS